MCVLTKDARDAHRLAAATRINPSVLAAERQRKYG